MFDVLLNYLKDEFGDKFTPDAAEGFKRMFTGFTANVTKQYKVIAEQQQQ